MGLDIVELVLEVEKEFAVESPDEHPEWLRSVGSLYDHMRECRTLGPDAPVLFPLPAGTYDGELWGRYLDVVERETGIDWEKLKPKASWIDDLGLDWAGK